MGTRDRRKPVASDARPANAQGARTSRSFDGYEWFLVFVLAVAVIAWVAIGVGPGP